MTSTVRADSTDALAPPPRIRAGEGLAITGILILAFGLRVWNIQAGIPYGVGVDEPEIMERAVRMMKTLDLNPRFFDWPTLTVYVQLGVSCVTFLAGSMRGLWSSLDEVGAANFYEAGRTMTAAFGTATVLVTYWAARRWGTRTALLAAALMAVMPNHVRESHYALADVPTAFFTTLAFLMALRALERPTFGAFAWAGAVVGLAASSKYNGLIAILLPAVAAVEGGGLALVAQRILVIGASAVGAFLLGTPYALLDLPKFLNDYARLAVVFARPRGGEPGWSLYLKYLGGSLAWPGMALAAAGLLVAAWRSVAGPGRARWIMLIGFPAFYFWVMARSYQIYGRYTLPLLPFTSLLAAIAVVAVARGLPWRPRVTSLAVTAVVAAVLATPAARSIAFDREIGRTSTVDLAYRWITEHVPPGAKIAIETRALLLPAEYPSVNMTSLAESDYDQYVAQGFDYVLASSVIYAPVFRAPAAHVDAHHAYRSVFGRAVEVATFVGTDEVPGPTLRLFKLQP